MTTKYQHQHHVPWYLWPFWAIWMLLATIVEMVGRFVAIVLGLVFILVGVLVISFQRDRPYSGVLVSLTVIGAIVGIPLAIIGLLLALRGIF